MGLTNVIKMLAMACPPSVRPAKPSAVPPAPAPVLTTQVSVVDGHRHWLDGLSLHDRIRHDRAFGHAWFAGNDKHQCQAIARKAIEGSRHVDADRGGPRDARTDARALPIGGVGAKKGPSGASTDPTTGNAATDRAGRVTGNHTIPNEGRANNPCEGMNCGVAHPTHHVCAGSNISRQAEQGYDRAWGTQPARNVKQGRLDKMRNIDVNGSFATTYAPNRDGNSRASSFCLFSR